MSEQRAFAFPDTPGRRVVCWWSAGIASATAAAMALKQHRAREVVVAYCDTSEDEHPDNLRFLADCERWYGQKLLRLRSDKYRNVRDVIERTGWLVGPKGARCTTELKKAVRMRFQRVDDIQVFGFHAGEEDRAEKFRRANPEIDCRFPLIERGMTKADCAALIRELGVEEPAMYRLGYKNNNCIGCVKAGMGYWNKIRRDFPEVFKRTADLERRLDIAILSEGKGDDRRRLFLDELDPGRGRYESEPDTECGVACGITLEEVA